MQLGEIRVRLSLEYNKKKKVGPLHDLEDID